MLAEDIQYLPLEGPLPGRSFELQTVEFLRGLLAEIDELKSQYNALNKEFQDHIKSNNETFAAHKALIKNAQDSGDLGQKLANAAQATADYAKAYSVPKGGVVLYTSTNAPTGWTSQQRFGDAILSSAASYIQKS